MNKKIISFWPFENILVGMFSVKFIEGTKEVKRNCCPLFVKNKFLSMFKQCNYTVVICRIQWRKTVSPFLRWALLWVIAPYTPNSEAQDVLEGFKQQTWKHQLLNLFLMTQLSKKIITIYSIYNKLILEK